METDMLDQQELEDSCCDIVFSHRGFPVNCGKHPIIWMNAIVDPEMTQKFFKISQDKWDEEVAAKGYLFRKATAVQVCSEAEAERHARTFPDIASRFVPIPLFVPHALPTSESILDKHRKAKLVKFLFVGNQARRKGLQETLNAFELLPPAARRSASLTVVSRFERGRIAIPNDPHIIVHRGLPQVKVLDLMRDSHVLVNVAHHESYSMIFPEAMSQGMLCLGPDWEVQRELFDNGHAGMNVRCDVNLLRDAMLRVIEDEDYRMALASSGWRRFNERYAPNVVACKYEEMFRAVVAGKYTNGANR
jgi:glycosyltransferase involved in cell wall biosynthesis